MHNTPHEKRGCLFVELDPFSSYHPHNLDKINFFCRQLKLACIFFDIVDINTDVFSHSPIVLSVFQELAPLVKSGLLWPSTGIKETPSDFIQRKLTDYAQRSIESDAAIYEIQQKWNSISPENFHIFRHSVTPQIKSALFNIESIFLNYKNQNYFHHIQHYLEIQKSEQRFNREDLITGLAFIKKSFSSQNIIQLAQFVSAEYIYQGTQNKQHNYTIFPGATALRLMHIHSGIANIGYDKSHIMRFNKALLEKNLSIKKLLNTPIDRLCALLHDDAFIFLRKNYIWPDEKQKNYFLQKIYSPIILENKERIKLKRTIKSSYALPLLQEKNTFDKNQQDKYLLLANEQPLLYLKNAINIKLSIEEHQLLKLIAYNSDSLCYLSETLQQLAVSKKYDTGKINFSINKKDINYLRNYLDAKIISPLNKKLSTYSLKIKSEKSIIGIYDQGEKLKLIITDIKTDNQLLTIIKEHASTLRESQIKTLLTNLELFATPIHTFFVTRLLNSTDETSTSKIIYKTNQILKNNALTIEQPSRGYYHLISILQEKTSKMR